MKRGRCLTALGSCMSARSGSSMHPAEVLDLDRTSVDDLEEMPSRRPRYNAR